MGVRFGVGRRAVVRSVVAFQLASVVVFDEAGEVMEEVHRDGEGFVAEVLGQGPSV